MNIILTRTKDEHLNLWWEPFATSTPLKPNSNNAEIGSVPQKQLPIHGNSPDFVNKCQKNCSTINELQKKSFESKALASKKIRKKKSSTYFDLTSSSDEDSSNGNKKRPIIKLRSRKKTNSLSVSKDLSNGKFNTNKDINYFKKLENLGIKDCESKAVFTAEDSKVENVQSHSSKNRTLNDNVKLESNFKDVSSDEDSKIFDETRKEKFITKNIISHFVNKENTINNSKTDGSLKYLNVFDNRGKKVLKKTFITNPIFKESVHKKGDYDSESLNTLQSRTSECNKLRKSQKRKGKDNESTVNIIKKTKIKMTNKLDKPVKNSGSILQNWECKINLSHQLFSDSKEQELINILDLTSEEFNENVESSLLQEKKKLPYKSGNSSHPSINESLNINECKQNQPKRKKQNWKKCLKSENLSNELLKNVNNKKKIKSKRNSKAKLANNGQIPELQMQQKSKELDVFSEVVDRESKIENDGKPLKAQRTPKKKTAKVPDKNKTSCAINDLLNKTDNKLKSSEVNSVLNSVGSSANNNNKTAYSIKSSRPKIDKKAINKNKQVFKLLNELSYKDSEMGCSVAQGWDLNNFKCGIFKLKVKSQMSCKTLHSSSNLGGILIKGNLKMKIGDRELNLTEGDMVLVPPLTKWQATNIGECETLFYYWCGRFNI